MNKKISHSIEGNSHTNPKGMNPSPNSIPYIIKIDPGNAKIKKKKSFFSKKPLLSLVWWSL